MPRNRHALGCPTQPSTASPRGHGHPKGLSYLPAQLDVLYTPRHLRVAYLHVDILIEPLISQSVRGVCARWGESLSKDVCLSPLTSERAWLLGPVLWRLNCLSMGILNSLRCCSVFYLPAPELYWSPLVLCHICQSHVWDTLGCLRWCFTSMLRQLSQALCNFLNKSDAF